MKASVDVVYLLVLAVCTCGFLLLLNCAQKAVLNELREVLCGQKDPERYLRMLQSKRLMLVLRRGTLLLLELDGYLAAADEEGVQRVLKKAAATKLRKDESLDLYQKLMNFFIKAGYNEQARLAYQSLEKLLAGEKDAGLKEILEDAGLLLGVYVDKDTGLIPRLLALQKEQSGRRRGITCYRLAKLYRHADNRRKALEFLELARADLRDTDWEPLVDQAIVNPNILERPP